MKKIFGFTLAEVMVALTIIGVIMVFYVPVHKVVAAQYTTLAYAGLENLSLASKELMSGAVNVTENGVVRPGLVDEGGKLILNSNTHAFCLCLADIMNIRGGAYCPDNESGYSGVTGSTPLQYKLTNTNNWTQPNIIATNGHKYYISSHQTQNDAVASYYGYRVIAIDVTGNKKPNSDSSEGQPADIVYYIMLDDGSVYPIGVAAENRNYINSRTNAYYFSSKNLPEGLIETKAAGCKNFLSFDGIQNSKDLVWTAPTGDKAPSQVGECNFWKQTILANYGDSETPEGTYSYRMAFCLKNGQGTVFKGYNCTGDYAQAGVCGVGGAADQCVLEPVKPLYKIKI